MHATMSSPLTLHDVQSAIRGEGMEPIDDVDFQETLAAHGCAIIAPWVCRITPSGNLMKLATLRYRDDRTLDKPAILLAVLSKLPEA